MDKSVQMAVVGMLCLAVLGGCTRYTDIREGINAIQSRSVPERLEVINGKYKIGSPDVINITVRDNIDLNIETVVRPDGNITFPLLGDVYVEGKTPEEVSRMLDTELANYIKDVQTTVHIVGFFSQKYYVFGEVNRPGPQPFTGDITLIDALASAGSLTIRSAPGRVRLVRPGLEKPEIFKINVNRIMKKGDGRLNLQLRESDIIYVPTNVFAKVGYAIDNLLYPFRSILGFAYTASLTQAIADQ